MSTPPRPLRLSAGRLATWSVLLLAVPYAPIAVTSMWFTVVPDAPRWQQRLDAAVGGTRYATGPGSVAVLRSADYVDHRVLMIGHTVLGGLALVVAAVQWAVVHKASGRAHRRLGTVYVVLVSTSMAAALLFLAVSPRIEAVGQVAFRWQLWVLATSTLGTGLVAVWCARRGDREGHRAWMALNLSFLLTAPALRLWWTLLSPLFPERDMLTNLEVGSVVLAVIAPVAGALASMRCRASGRPATRGDEGPAHGRLLVLVAIAVLGCLAVLARQPGDMAGPGGLPWFHTVPVLLAVAICTIGVVRSCAAPTRAAEWRTLLGGVALAPWTAVLLETVAARGIGATEAYLAGLMVAPGFPVVAAVGTGLARRRATEPPIVEVLRVTPGKRRQVPSTRDV